MQKIDNMPSLEIPVTGKNTNGIQLNLLELTVSAKKSGVPYLFWAINALKIQAKPMFYKQAVVLVL